jgi:hypothetical protein
MASEDLFRLGIVSPIVVIAQLVGVVQLLGDEGTRAAFSAEQVNVQAMSGIAAVTDI